MKYLGGANSNLTSTKNLESIINSVINAKAPERFTNKFLEDLGYKSSNDRLVIGMFKALGLLDDNGQPLQRYYEFLDQTQTGKNKAIEIGFAVDNTLSVHIVEKPFLRLVGQGVGQQIFVLHQNFHLLLHRLVFFCTACLRINISVVKFFYKPWHK